MENKPRVDSRTTAHAGKFLAFKQLVWTDAYGVSRTWESSDRMSNHGAVLIMAHLTQSDRVVLIRQYRPPAEKFVIEFPAGLMDAGETAEEAAARELREETGYIAGRLEVNPPAYTTPGMSDEYVYMVRAFIDETSPENANPKTDFDPSESIETLLVPRKELAEFYRTETKKGHAFDAKLAAYVLAVAGE